jgi:hypothetical protein
MREDEEFHHIFSIRLRFVGGEGGRKSIIGVESSRLVQERSGWFHLATGSWANPWESEASSSCLVLRILTSALPSP